MISWNPYLLTAVLRTCYTLVVQTDLLPAFIECGLVSETTHKQIFDENLLSI